VIALVLIVSGCGNKENRNSDKLDVAAAALLSGNRQELNPVSAADEAAAEKLLAEKRAKAKAEEEELAKSIAALTVLPAQLPKSLEIACEGLLEAYHGFQLRVRANDGRALMNWWDNKRLELGKVRQTCMALASVQAAACQTNALTQAEGKFGAFENKIMGDCVELFAAKNRDEVRRLQIAEQAANK
jgi:hypothetical protein